MTRPLGPPAWADALVSLVLNVEDRESVTGDLIEEYCETILPAVGKTRAVLWYLQQVAGYVWRAVWFWAMLHTIEFLARTAIDWFWPTHDFVARATFSTYAGLVVGLSIGLCSGWRTASIRGGAFAGFASSAVASLMIAVGAGLMFGLSHDPATRSAIQGSGGLPEVFELPLMLIVPHTLLGAVGAIPGKFWRQQCRLRLID